MAKRENIFIRFFNFFRDLFTPISYADRNPTYENILNARQMDQDTKRRPEEIERLEEGIDKIPFLAQREKEIRNKVTQENPSFTRYFKGKNGVTLEIKCDLTDNGKMISYHTTDENGVRDMLPVKEAFDLYGPFKEINKEKQDKILDKKGKSDRFLVNEFTKFEGLTSRYAIVMADGINITQDDKGNLIYSIDKVKRINGRNVIDEQKLSQENVINQFLKKYKYNNQELPKPEIFVNRALLEKDLKEMLDSYIIMANGQSAKTGVIHINNKTYTRKEIEAALNDNVKFEKIAKDVEKQLRAKPLLPIKIFDKDNNIELTNGLSKKLERAERKYEKIKEALDSRDAVTSMGKDEIDEVYARLNECSGKETIEEAVLIAARENKNIKIYDENGKEFDIHVTNKDDKVLVHVKHDGKINCYDVVPKNANLTNFSVNLTKGQEINAHFLFSEKETLAAKWEIEKQESIDRIYSAIETKGITAQTVKDMCDNMHKYNENTMDIDNDIHNIRIDYAGIKDGKEQYEIIIDGNKTDAITVSLEDFDYDKVNELIDNGDLDKEMAKAEKEAEKENEEIAKDNPNKDKEKDSQDQNL